MYHKVVFFYGYDKVMKATLISITLKMTEIWHSKLGYLFNKNYIVLKIQKINPLYIHWTLIGHISSQLKYSVVKVALKNL